MKTIIALALGYSVLTVITCLVTSWLLKRYKALAAKVQLKGKSKGPDLIIKANKAIAEMLGRANKLFYAISVYGLITGVLIGQLYNQYQVVEVGGWQYLTCIGGVLLGSIGAITCLVRLRTYIAFTLVPELIKFRDWLNALEKLRRDN